MKLMVRAASAVLATLLLASCGGGGGGGGDDAATCSLDEQKSWLARYMDTEYFWYDRHPRPDAAPFERIQAFFEALLFTGDATVPTGDVWSFTESTASFDQFYGEGRTLGYGLFVAGIEIADTPSAPLRVRYIEPASPAATAGLQRGETIVALNDRPAAEYHPDFGVLSPAEAGDVLRLRVRNAQGVERDVSLTARVFDLTPVSDSRVVTSPAGTPIGYVVLKDFISQAGNPLHAAFADFKARGVREVVLDLRYNGGGLVSTAALLASYVVGSGAVGGTFALLRHNDQRQAANSTFRFTQQAQALGATRVFVLGGPRTCSASELVINGLKPFVDVVQIGDTSCGKPVGFVPVDRCGNTFSAVNFESVNADGEGRYWSGLAPRCAVADDLDHALGDPAEGLLAEARGYVDAGACPSGAARERPLGVRPRVGVVDEGDRPGRMIGR
jgi:carboxyl-terminal processing protease